MATTATVSAATCIGAENRVGGAVYSNAARVPPAAPTAPVAVAAAATRASASASPDRPSWCARSVARSRIGMRGAASTTASTSQRPPTVQTVAAPSPVSSSAAASRASRRATRAREPGWAPSSPVRATTPSISGCRSAGTSGRALLADQRVALLHRELAAVVDEEAARARELVRLPREHPDAELLPRQVRTGELQRLGQLGLVDVDDAGGLVDAPCLELLDAVLAELVVGLARGVVVGRHGNAALRPLLVLPGSVLPGPARWCAARRPAGRPCGRPASCLPCNADRRAIVPDRR